MKEFRFGVGSLTTPRSTVWKVWTTGDDAYIQSRMMGSSAKVSLHKDGQCQWSLNSDWYGVNRPGAKNSGRHIARWKRKKPEEDRASLVFRIIIPESELRRTVLPESLKNVHWIPSPVPNRAQIIECYITPPAKDRGMKFPFAHLASLELADFKLLVLLTHDEIVTDEQTNQLLRLRDEAKKSIALKPEYRGVGFAQWEQGERGMIEFVPLAN